jgi:hypothetical protein
MLCAAQRRFPGSFHLALLFWLRHYRVMTRVLDKSIWTPGPLAVSGAAFFTLFMTGCGDGQSAANLFDQWENTCPEQAAAISAEPIDSETWDRWRTGDLEALDCWILRRRGIQARDEDRHWALGPAPEIEPSMDSHRRSQFFELLYYRWRATGEGREELEAMAAAMERRWVDSALRHHQFRLSARYPITYNADMSISADDPGHRFLELAKPDTPETAPPVLDAP